MDNGRFQEWLSEMEELTAAQRTEAEAALSGQSQASASLAAVEAGIGEDRRCPHCGTPGAVSRGRANGLRRYQCKGCKRTFNAATGTPLAGLHHKDRLLGFGACLRAGNTLRESAAHCGIDITTAFRWRHRFLAVKNREPEKLTGIVEADETWFPESLKGKRKPARKARRRGGKAGKRGVSREQVPVLVVADRAGTTVGAVLPAVNAGSLRKVIGSVVDRDIILAGDGHTAYPPCAAAMGVRHGALNMSRGERVRDAFHIQTVNSRHSHPSTSCGVTAVFPPNILTTGCDGSIAPDWRKPLRARFSLPQSTGHA